MFNYFDERQNDNQYDTLYLGERILFDQVKFSKIKKIDYLIFDNQSFGSEEFKSQSYKEYLSKVKNVIHLTLEIDQIIQTGQETQNYNFKWIENIIERYKETIQSLTLRNFKFIQQIDSSESNIDQIDNYLSDLISPLKHFRQLKIEEELTSLQIEPHFILQPLYKLISQKKELFKDLQIFGIQLKCNKQIVNQSPNELIQLLLNILSQLQYLDRLEELDLQLSGLNIDENIYNKILQQISQIKQITKISLDFTNNCLIQKKLIDSLQCLSVFSQNLQDFKFSFNAKLDKNQMNDFTEILKQFQKLQSLSLTHLELTQGVSLQLIKCISLSQNLKYLNIDMAQFLVKNDAFEKIFQELTTLSKQFINFQVVLPQSISITQNNSKQFLNFLNESKEQLEVLKIQFRNKCNDECFIQLADQIIQIKNLKELELIFKKDFMQYFIRVSSAEQEVENIFCLKEYQYKPAHQSLIDGEQKFRKIIMSALLSAQKYQLQEFHYDSKAQSEEECISQPFYSYYLKNMEYLYKQKNIKRLILGENEGLNQIDNIKLLKNNQESLVFLSTLRQNSQIAGYYEMILSCTNIFILNLSFNSIDTDQFSLKNLLLKLPYLQKLILMKYNYSREQRQQIDYRELNYSNYLVSILISGIQINQFQSIRLLRERQIAIDQLRVYNEFILPQLIFQQQYTHLDLYFD